MTVDPLLALYESADSDTRKRGRKWYPETRRRLRQIARKNERPLAQAVAVFAITSVAAQLQTNLRWTEEILAGLRTGGRYPNVQAPLVAGALSTRYPSRYARGPKVGAFYRALMGDVDALVIDRWAARAAGVKIGNEKHYIPIGAQRAMDEAYRTAAAQTRERVRDFQAIVWLVKRESTPTAKGVVPKLWDVTISES